MANETKKSIFETLNNINVNEHIETKGQAKLKYLSWAWAWAEVKKVYPDANYTIYETTNPQGYTINYFTDGRTCWVKTGVTINGLEHIEELPVMDYNNKSILLNNVSSFDVNKAIQRSLTKALARHGLGLYIYAGEDLPDEADLKGTTQETPKVAPKQATSKLIKGVQENAGTITEMQRDTMKALGINVGGACAYLEVPEADLLSYEQAQWIIDSKTK